MTRVEWLERYDALEERRAALQAEILRIERSGDFEDYNKVDEERADINELLADLADDAARLLWMGEW